MDQISIQKRGLHNLWGLHGRSQCSWSRISGKVYKDAIEHEVRERQINYCREREYVIHYKEIILPHKYYADFVLFDNIILEVKAAEGGISDAFIAQMLNYLKASGCKIGLIVNFGRSGLEYRRLIF